MKNTGLKVGAAHAPIEWIKETFPLEGFDAVHDEVSARGIYMEGQQKVFLLSLEMTSLPPQAVQHFKTLVCEMTGLDEAHVIVSVTHTFSVPHIPRWEETAEDQALAAAIYRPMDKAVKQVVQSCLQSATDVTVGWGSSPCLINVNRNVETPKGWWIGRNSRAYSDHDLQCLTFYREDTPAAVIVSYDCQPSVLDHVTDRAGKKYISGDLAGEMMRKLEQKYPAMTAVFMPGAAGDQAPLIRGIMPKADGTEENLCEEAFVMAREFGRYLAECAEGPIRHPSYRKMQSDVTMKRKDVLLPEQKMQFATRDLKPGKTFSFESTGNHQPCPVIRLHIGDISMFLTSPELNSAYGKLVKEAIGGTVMVGTLVDGAMKYLPQEEDFTRITYTAMNTMIGRGADRLLLEAIEKLNYAEADGTEQREKE